MKIPALAAAAVLAALPAAVATAAPDPALQGAVQCDRACLQTAMDQVLAAMVAHDASKLPLAPGVRYTENGQALALNDGFWNTASGRGKYSHYFLDPRTDQAGFMGVVKENGDDVIMALRIALQGRQISEIEAVMGRSGLGTAGPNGAKNLEALGKPDDIWFRDIPAAERASREDIIRVSNMYFSNLQNNDGKGDYSFFADDCYRLENGIQTTSGPHPAPPRPTPAAGAPAPAARRGPDMFSLGCRQGFETGYFRIVTRIRDRRFPLVDEDKGVAFAFGFFDHAGNVHDFPLSDGTISPGGIKAPFTWEIAEAFRVEKGKIKTVEAVLNNAPYGMKGGWDGK
ncbi:MAG: hypothetical protein ACXU82_06470 [Caulobacteraceae bacterium]